MVNGKKSGFADARKSQDRPDGGIIELEGPIHISNVRKIESKTTKVDSSKPQKEASQESEATDNS